MEKADSSGFLPCSGVNYTEGSDGEDTRTMKGSQYKGKPNQMSVAEFSSLRNVRSRKDVNSRPQFLGLSLNRLNTQQSGLNTDFNF